MMKPRPIYRWKSFWLGVAVLVFLMWAWARSISRIDGVYHGDFATDVSREMNSSGGAIRYHYNDLSGSKFYDVRFEGWLIESSERVRKYYWFPAGVKIQRQAGRMVMTEVAVAYWLVVLVFAISWGAMLGWKWKRERREME